jgi:alpha-amylase
MPFVYYGEEIGMVGPKPDELIRTPMQWSSAPNSGFTNGTPWEPLQTDWKTKNVAAQDSSPESLLNHYRNLIQLRNANTALSRGPLTLLETRDTTGAVVTWLRSWGDSVFLIVVNFGSRDTEAYVERLPERLIPATRYRPEPAYADPPNACAGLTYLNGTQSVLVKKVTAHGLCVLRIRPR